MGQCAKCRQWYATTYFRDGDLNRVLYCGECLALDVADEYRSSLKAKEAECEQLRNMWNILHTIVTGCDTCLAALGLYAGTKGWPPTCSPPDETHELLTAPGAEPHKDPANGAPCTHAASKILSSAVEQIRELGGEWVSFRVNLMRCMDCGHEWHRNAFPAEKKENS